MAQAAKAGIIIQIRINNPNIAEPLGSLLIKIYSIIQTNPKQNAPTISMV